MTTINAEQIKELRERTGAGISEIRKALIEAGGDSEQALSILERALGARGDKSSLRETRQGLIDCYVHSDRKIGVLVEMFCETDFVARNLEFRALAHDVSLHIAAMNPSDDTSLLAQPFVKNADKTVGDVIREAAGKFGENIKISRFIRFAL